MSRLLPLLLLCLSCTSADRYRTHRAPDTSPITVLVPGYRGSFLYDGERLFYLKPGDAVQAGHEMLGTCADGMRPLNAGGPVTKFTIWPYAFNVYGPFMEWGEQALPGFTGYGYDWRISLPETAEKLCAFIGDKQANLIGHSMGGLVTMLAIERCPEKIRAAVFAGVPFNGAPGLFKDLFVGSPTFQNTAWLSAEALWTFPATWQLLPRTDDWFVDDSGAKVTVPLSDVATWAKWHVPCAQRLADRLADRALMPAQFKTPEKLKALAVIGKGLPVTAAVRRSGDFFDWNRPLRGDGDGTVSIENATPSFAHQEVYTKAEHTNLLDDPAVREAIERFLNE